MNTGPPTSQSVSAHAALHAICQVSRFTVTGIWLYQALVPKLLGPHHDELALAAAFGIPERARPLASYTAAAVELVVGLLVLFVHRHAWPQVLSAMLTLVLLLFVMLCAPAYLAAAFNPAVMNCASIALSAVAVIALRAQVPNGG